MAADSNRENKDNKKKFILRAGSYWSTIFFLLVVGGVFSIGAQYFGIDLAQTYSSQIIGAVILAIIGVLVIDRYKELAERTDSLRERVESVSDALNARMQSIQDSEANKVTDAVKSQVKSLREEIDELQRQHPWLSAIPEESINSHSNDLSVKLNDFYTLFNTGEKSSALRLLYDVPRLSMQPKNKKLHATPIDIEKAANLALFSIGDNQLAEKIHLGYSTKYKQNKRFLASYLRALVSSYSMDEADRIVVNLILTMLPQNSPSVLELVIRMVFPNSVQLKEIDVDAETASSVFGWRLCLALTYYYSANGLQEMAEVFKTASALKELNASQSEERLLATSEINILNGNVVDLTESEIGAVVSLRCRSRLLHLRALSASRFGQWDTLVSLDREAMRTPKLDGLSTYYVRETREIVTPAIDTGAIHDPSSVSESSDSIIDQTVSA